MCDFWRSVLIELPNGYLLSLALFWIKDFAEVWNFFFGKTEMVGTAILYVRVDVDCLN